MGRLDCIFSDRGVIDTANQATQTAKHMMRLFEDDRLLIEESGKSTAAVLSIHTYLQKQPVTNTTHIKEACSVSLPTVLRGGLNTLEQLGIVKEITGKERNKVFAYRQYLDILSHGTEPLEH